MTPADLRALRNQIHLYLGRVISEYFLIVIINLKKKWMIALLYKDLYTTDKHVEVSAADDSFCSMLSVTEPLCNLNLKPGNFYILESESRPHVTHALTWASVRMLALYLEHVYIFCL